MSSDPSYSVVFMGSPSFAVPTLEALIGAPDFDVVRVVSQPDRGKGRGKRPAPTPVRECAERHGVPTSQMTKENYAGVARELAALALDFVVVVAFGLILRKDLIDLPRLGCVNLHASLLPKYRGVSPIQAAILAGDAETGVTTMMIDEGIDTGDTLLAARIEIAPDDTTGSLQTRLAALGAPLVLDTLRGLASGSVEPSAQDDSVASYTKKIKKKHGAIDWTQSADDIARRVRAMQPWPTAYTTWGGKRLIVLDARPFGAVEADAVKRRDPGTVLQRSPLVVATGAGALEIARVKVEGKKEMSAQAFIAGYRIKIGDRLGSTA